MIFMLSGYSTINFWYEYCGLNHLLFMVINRLCILAISQVYS